MTPHVHRAAFVQTIGDLIDRPDSSRPSVHACYSLFFQAGALLDALVSRIPASVLRDAVLDPGSFVSWDTGGDESVVTGEGRVRGRRVAVIASEFDFLAGSIGVAAAERITSAVERATRERLPLLASPSSGGTRMQEGTVAFLQMVKIAAAVELHKRAHLPYLVYLRHPTTGGVFASWGSLGHVTIAEPGALIGFLGPRVYEHLYGEPFPPGVQTAENLQRHGVIDGVVPVKWLRRTLERALKVMVDSPGPAPATTLAEPIPDVPAWESVVASRRPDRPGVGRLLRHGATERVLLSGTGQGEAATTLLALARFRKQPAVVLGQQRTVGAVIAPAALREARRGMALAAGLRLPLVLVIDTAGPALSAEAEQEGLAGEIARCLADLVMLCRRRRSRCCSVRAAAARRWRWSPRTGCWPHCTAGLPRCHPKARARSSTATPHTHRNWRPRKASGPPTCWRQESSTQSCPSTPTPPTNPSTSPNACRRRSPLSCPRCGNCRTTAAMPTG